MSQAQWQTHTYPPHLLGLVRDRAGDRKLRLFACACARRVAHLVKDERAKQALAFAEQMAERGTAGRKGRPAVERAARQACDDLWKFDKTPLNAASLLAHLAEANATHAALLAVAASAYSAAQETCTSASLAAAYSSCKIPKVKTDFPPDRHDRIKAEERQQILILKDINGDPFRPVAADPAHRQALVRALARAAYVDRRSPSGELDPVRLAVVADALEDAAASVEVVEHLRGPGPHVPGCWALDLCLEPT
jgi:hypothetical protein